MVGLSMALTIAICVGVFVASYAQVGSALSDFLPEDATFVPTPEAGAAQTAADAPVPAAPTPAPEPPVPPGQVATGGPAAGGTGTEPAFQPTHVITPGSPINFRRVPGVAGPETVITTLTPGTELRSLDEEQTIDDAVWMRFEIANGDQGWVRQVDTEQVDGAP